MSRVTPIPKVASSNSIDNHRPIAVLSVFAKLFEIAINNQIKQQTQIHMSDCQYGFRAGRSTLTNHINFVHYTLAEMDAGNQVDVAYFDLRKSIRPRRNRRAFVKTIVHRI